MEVVTICIPAKNEESVILETLDTVLAMCDTHPEYHWQILVVDNGSTDDTAGFVSGYEDERVTLISEPKVGKGAAVLAGARSAVGEYFAFIDADISAHPQQLPALLFEVVQGLDVAVGSRFVNTDIVHRPKWRTLTSELFNFYASYVVPVPVRDSQCPLKVMNSRGKNILLTSVDSGWFFDREFLAKAHKRALKIQEFPVFWEEFRYPHRKSKLHVLKTGLASLWSLWKINRAVAKF